MFIFVCTISIDCVSLVAPQSEVNAKLQQDSLEVRCINRVTELCNWYAKYSLSDESLRHTLQQLTPRIKRIDTLGVKREVNRYYKSGFFTRSWKEQTIKNALAADTILAWMKTNDEAEMEEYVYKIPGVIGDPIFSLASHRYRFEESGYEWDIKEFHDNGDGTFSVNVYLITEDKVGRWPLELVIEGNEVKINRIGGRDMIK